MPSATSDPRRRLRPEFVGSATVLTKPELPVTASGHELGVVNSAVYAGGRRVADVAIEEAGEWSKRPGHVVWIGLVEPSDDLLQRVRRHPLNHWCAMLYALT
jgi:hypothetical protein